MRVRLGCAEFIPFDYQTDRNTQTILFKSADEFWHRLWSCLSDEYFPKIFYHRIKIDRTRIRIVYESRGGVIYNESEVFNVPPSVAFHYPDEAAGSRISYLRGLARVDGRRIVSGIV